MKSYFLFFSFFISINIFGQTMSLTDSSQLISIINDWNQAWTVKDYSLASNGYSNDAKFTNAFGDQRNGRKDIAALLKEVFSLPFVMAGKSETLGQTFKILCNDVIIVQTIVARRGQNMPDGSSIAERKTTHLRVFKKIDNKWQIEAHLISDARDKQSSKH